MKTPKGISHDCNISPSEVVVLSGMAGTADHSNKRVGRRNERGEKNYQQR